MQFRSSPQFRAVAGLVFAALLAACSDTGITNTISPANQFTQTNLVADAAGATTVDANVVNSWGIAFSPTGILWVSNDATGTSTLYDSLGAKLSTIVSIPSAAGGAGHPTGVAFNSTSSFSIAGAGPALFLFAELDGTISGWNGLTGNAITVVNRSTASAEYTGLAIASNAGADFLYAADFTNNAVDVFNSSFQFQQSFTDTTMAAGYGPFGIAAIGGQLYVTYAKHDASNPAQDAPGVGNGFVDVFNANGTLARRFIANGRLNSPWAVVMAPAGFSAFGGDVLVGNFGDGTIGAYDATTGALVDVLRTSSGAAVTIDGLWGLAFEPVSGSTKLYFAAGPSDETHGLVGTLTAP